MIKHRQPFQVQQKAFAVSRRAEQLRLRRAQRIVATAADSVLRTEMTDLEPQEQNAPQRVLWYKPMAWLGVIRPHHRDEAWSASLWQTSTSHMNVGGVAVILCLTAASTIPFLLLNDAAAEKLREYRADYSNRPSDSMSVMPAVATTSAALLSTPRSQI